MAGMFRSGTTLIARMFQSHPEVACASDPFAPLFKMFRNSYAREVGYDVDPTAPLDDYYFYEPKAAFLKGLQQASLEMGCKGVDWVKAVEQLASFSKPYSPLMYPHFNQLPANNFKQTLANGVDLIQQVYGDKQTSLVGFKEVWVNEFGLHIARDFPESKVLHIVRDPRAVCASNYVSSGPYPFVFLVRQWRKLSAAAMYQKKFSPQADQVFILRYEDLITEPDKYIPQVCEFLEIEPHDNMYDPTTFLDGNNQPWIQNSSHKNPIKGFNTKSLNRWKDVLSTQHLSMIEAMCYGEMKLFGYELTQEQPSLTSEIVFNPPEIEQYRVSDWLKPFVDQREEVLVKEMALELYRLNTLLQDQPVNQVLASRFGLWDQVFELMQGSV